MLSSTSSSPKVSILVAPAEIRLETVTALEPRPDPDASFGSVPTS